MKKTALSVFRQLPERLNCAQSVLHAWQEHKGNAEEPIESFRPFGSGRAPDGRCGALHAAITLAPDQREDLERRFAEQVGATHCAILKKELKVPCEQSVATACDLLGSVSLQKTQSVRIALPWGSDDFCSHFGGASHFYLIEVESCTGQVLSHDLHSAPEHKPGAYPAWLARQEVNIVLAGGLGERALALLTRAGIQAYLIPADHLGSWENWIQEWKAGSLTKAEPGASGCTGHHDHSHDEEEHHHNDGCEKHS